MPAGQIAKPHGTRGAVIVQLHGDFAGFLIPGKPLFLEISGTMIPFFIQEAEGSGSRIVLKLAFIDTPEEAARYSGCNIYIDTPGHAVPDNGLKELTGYNISDDTSGITGVITGITGPPMNPLFEVKSEDKDYYIPAQADLISHIDHKSKRIRLKLPDGFSEI